MKSLRRTIAFIIILALLILIAMSMLNFFYIKSVFNDLEKFNDSITTLNTIYIELDLPIKVIDNLLYQLPIHPTINFEHFYNLADSNTIDNVQDRIQQLNSKLLKLSQVNEELINSTEQLNSRRLYNILEELSLINDSVNNINEKNNQLIHLVSEFTSNYPNKDLIKEIIYCYESTKEDINTTIISYNSFRKKLTLDYIHFTFIAFITTLVIIGLLSTILVKFLIYNIPFIIEGFMMLSRHDYNHNNLPQMHEFFSEETSTKNLVHSVIQEQKIIDEIKLISSNEFILEDVLDSIFNIINSTLKTDRLGVAFVNYSQEKIIAEHGVFKYNNVLLGPGFEVSFKDTSLTELIHSKKPAVINSVEKELRKRPHSRPLRLLLDEGVKSNMIIPLKTNTNVIGFLFFSSINENNYDEKSLLLGKNIAYELSSIISKTYLTQKMFANVTKTFADIVEKKDYETGDHIKRMTSYAKIISQKLINHDNENYRVKQSFINDIENNAAVHDIGKVAIPDNILNKPGKLTPEEWQIMKGHASIGADLLVGLKDSLQIFNKNFFEIAIYIARYHHERWDGSGYPDGLSRESIPLAARIIAIADVFDAMSTKRVYKDPYTFDATVKYINENSGSHFDPVLVNIFNSSLNDIKEVYDSQNL
ncbi:HD domain-containing phosphohydrolase [Alkaliphilus peptidifermentans]|uniref:Response regulator c-di-GMP phosphodiesterase, RpfG family, contains REC and HD-GYP domains n=1 Tax=Alkaliphilus peptidifermentans DSM 18978 TaxID=1120976 RepID=A0A1G5JQW7_9FIRM|nr:HD domain-containing phosphohydrolase [Alkaliphilus peptidifermentans]SCY90726.1 Response regulator c-di-GMP phosphodiesterase, RpfG family, contains REC and HD-GYP domains [Alkaliphilus peptidifermentans DSM 18978]